MTADQDEKAEVPETLPYARNVPQPWTGFQLHVAVTCGIALFFLGVSTAELLYSIPGERQLFPWPTDFELLALYAALSSPVILFLSIFSLKPEIVAAAAVLFVLAIVWTVRMIMLLSHL